MTTIDVAVLPLSGIRVLDLTRLLPGNFCTLALALMGADVIKVEDKGAGDYIRVSGEMVGEQSALHHLVNRGKRSICLDLKHEDDRRAFEVLVTGSDVLIESFRPGVMARLGYTPERLHELCPRLVIASITAYGATGPLASRAGHDINCLGFAGLLERLGDERSGPILPPVPLADLIGGLLPALMVTAYVRRAEQTGQGAVIDTSLAEAIALLPTSAIANLLAGADMPGRGSFKLGRGLASFGVYPCRDGHVAVGSQERHFWQALCGLVDGLDEFRERQADAKAQDRIRECLQRFFAPRTRREIADIFAERDACVSPVLSYEEMLASEHAQARQFVVSDERIPLPVLAFPAMVDGARLPERGPAPAQGQDTDAILAELPASKARAHTSTPHGAAAAAGSTEAG